MYYGVRDLDNDPVGMKDLLERGPHRKKWEELNYYGFALVFFGDGYVVWHPSKEKSRFTAENIVDRIFEHFNNAIKNWQGKEFRAQRLLAYAWLARELEIAHVFPDGNGRSSNLAFISMVAGDDDLPMVLFEDPNVLDCNSPEKLCYRIFEGMENFLKKGHAKLYTKSNEFKSLADLKIDSSLQPLLNEVQALVKNKEWKDIHSWFEGYYKPQCSRWEFFVLRTEENLDYYYSERNWKWLRPISSIWRTIFSIPC